jgi:TRAP transporter TAXI family solute receptor
MKTKITLLLMAVGLFSFSNLIGQMTILSGPEQGSYYQFVQDIKTVLANEEDKQYINQATSGAANNFEQLIDPASPAKLALIQSDYLYYTQAIDFRENTNKTKDIKVVLPLANEEIHLVTRKSTGLTRLDELEKKVVAIGDKNQGTYATASFIKEKSQIFWSSRNIHFDQALKELLMNRLDAFFFVGSAPIEKLNVNPQVMVDELTLIELHDINNWAKYYEPDTIYTTDYKWLEKNVPTYSVKTVLVVNEAKLTKEDRVALSRLVSGIQNQFDVLKAEGHPKWKEVDLFDWDEEEWPLYK